MREFTEEERKNIARIMHCIEAFENGDDDYLSAVELIIEGITDHRNKMKGFIRTINKNLTKGKFSLLKNGVTLSEVKDLFAKSDADFEYYKECEKVLARYLEVGKKTGEYPDLAAAYLLTIHLSGIIDNIRDYTNEVSNIVKGAAHNYSYTSGSKVDEVCNERKQTVETLINSIRKK